MGKKLWFLLILFLPIWAVKFQENKEIHPVRISVVATIGAEEAKNMQEEPYQFYYISSIECDNEGNLYVLDSKDVCVKIFDRKGTFLRRILKEGQGPEEIKNSYKLAFNKFAGHIFILQEHGFQMKEFDSFGKFIRLYALPEQLFYYFDFIDKDRILYISMGGYGKNTYSNFRIINLETLKIEKEFAPTQRPPISNACQRFVVKDNVLWTCPGDRMELDGYDLKTGDKVNSIKLSESYKEFSILKGANWEAVRLYNFAQPFLINENVFLCVTKQDFPPPNFVTPTTPLKRQIKLYGLENDHLKMISGFPEFDFFVDFHTSWQNHLIISSSGYDLFPQIKVLEFN